MASKTKYVNQFLYAELFQDCPQIFSHMARQYSYPNLTAPLISISANSCKNSSELPENITISKANEIPLIPPAAIPKNYSSVTSALPSLSPKSSMPSSSTCHQRKHRSKAEG